MFSSYITVPVYTEFYKWLGWGERIQPMLDAWNARDRQKAAAEAPWEAIEQMFIFGSPEEMKERLEAVRRRRRHHPDPHPRRPARAGRPR